MPVEIREIVLRARVTDDAEGQGQKAATLDVDALTEQILEACRREIMAELRRRTER